VAGHLDNWANIWERFEGYLEDLTRLKSAGYQPKAIVSDGNIALLKAAGIVFPEVPQQRCLLHLQRQCLLWLTQ
jgi:transposase-like protein